MFPVNISVREKRSSQSWWAVNLFDFQNISKALFSSRFHVLRLTILCGMESKNHKSFPCMAGCEMSETQCDASRCECKISHEMLHVRREMCFFQHGTINKHFSILFDLWLSIPSTNSICTLLNPSQRHSNMKYVPPDKTDYILNVEFFWWTLNLGFAGVLNTSKIVKLCRLHKGFFMAFSYAKFFMSFYNRFPHWWKNIKVRDFLFFCDQIAAPFWIEEYMRVESVQVWIQDLKHRPTALLAS